MLFKDITTSAQNLCGPFSSVCSFVGLHLLTISLLRGPQSANENMAYSQFEGKLLIYDKILQSNITALTQNDW